MNSKGFITIISLLVLLIISFITFNLLDLVLRDADLIKSREDKTPSQYESKNKIILSLNDEEIFKSEILPNVRNGIKNRIDLKTYYLRLDRRNLHEDDFNDVVKYSFDYAFKPFGNWPFLLNFETDSEINNIKTSVIAKIAYINPIFLRKNNEIINIYEYDYEEKFKELCKDIDYNSEDELYKNDNFFRLRSTSSKYNSLEILNTNLLIRTDQGVDALEDEEVALFMKSNDSKLTIVNRDEFKKTIKLSGIIYINGDIRIKNNFTFDGIIIINNGSIIIEDGAIFTHKGILLNDEILDDYYFYNEALIYKYGIYLPGFVDLNIFNIKEK